jgi:hypothetical protein
LTDIASDTDTLTIDGARLSAGCAKLSAGCRRTRGTKLDIQQPTAPWPPHDVTVALASDANDKPLS